MSLFCLFVVLFVCLLFTNTHVCLGCMIGLLATFLGAQAAWVYLYHGSHWARIGLLLFWFEFSLCSFVVLLCVCFHLLFHYVCVCYSTLVWLDGGLWCYCIRAERCVLFGFVFCLFESLIVC